MRSITHWTPRYIYSRIVEKAYRACNRNMPWLTPSANAWLAEHITSSDVGLEVGSGRSTFWFAEHVSFLTSVESNPVWYQRVSDDLSSKAMDNVDFHLLSVSAQETPAEREAYKRFIEKINNCSLDFALIDGKFRDVCSAAVLDKLKPGAVLIIDNANWFLPSGSKSPHSRTHDDGPLTESWCQVYEMLSHWETLWTSSGVTDTAFFFKPQSS